MLKVEGPQQRKEVDDLFPGGRPARRKERVEAPSQCSRNYTTLNGCHYLLQDYKSAKVFQKGEGETYLR